MDYIERINRAIAFIENHLTENFSLADVASEACLSYFHFHRVFKILTGMTINEYVKNRRLSEAAKKIHDGMAITDAALEYCFNDQQSFTRSFRERFSVPPGQYRKFGLKNSIMERCIFTQDLIDCFNTLTGQTPEITFIKPTRYVGLLYKGKNIHDENMRLNYKLVKRMEEIPYRMENELTIFDRYTNEGGILCYTYITAFMVSEVKSIPEGMVDFVFGGREFAVFKYRGTSKILRDYIYDYIFNIWTFNSPWQTISEEFKAARFHNNFCVPENEDVEIIIPVRKK